MPLCTYNTNLRKSKIHAEIELKLNNSIVEFRIDIIFNRQALSIVMRCLHGKRKSWRNTLYLAILNSMMYDDISYSAHFSGKNLRKYNFIQKFVNSHLFFSLV